MIKASEFIDFTDGVQAAELSGYWVDKCREQLEGVEPIPSIDEERTLYKSVAGFHLLNEAISLGVDVVLVSRTGALALKGSTDTNWRVPFQFAKALDNENYTLPIAVTFVESSDLIFSQALLPLEIDGIVAGFSIPDTLDGLL